VNLGGKKGKLVLIGNYAKDAQWEKERLGEGRKRGDFRKKRLVVGE